MNDFANDHQPTPEFRAALEREIARAMRVEIMFEKPRGNWRPWTVIGIAAGAVMTLTIGLVLGASTGYASAGEIIKKRGDTPLPPTAGLAVLKNIPPLMFACGNVPPVRAAQLPPVQQGVPIIDLPAAHTRTATTFGGILGVRQVSSGNVIVNDADRRQMKLFDSTLALVAVVRDSVPGSATSYGSRPVPLIRYLGDSSLIADNQAGSLLIMAANGQIARAVAPLEARMIMHLNLGFGAVDDQGRILFASGVRDFSRGLDKVYSVPDSAVVIRADLESRRADTLARLKTWPSTMMIKNGPNTPTRFSMDPLPLIDEWAALSDGSIAVVRGHDYHIDWILPDGSTRSAPKMPFDWKRLTDEDKQKLIDSVRNDESPKMARALGQRRAAPPPDGEPGRGGRGAANAADMVQGPPAAVEYVPPTLKEMFDFSPPLRRGALMPDLDANLWILPSSSAQSRNGELVYDVVNAKGDFHRVRVPLGRSIVGFGKGGVVYMIAGDKTNGFYLERTTLPKK